MGALRLAEDRREPTLSETQEIVPPTAADVLEVFTHFQASILMRIDERDANVLRAMRSILSDVLEQYHKQTSRSDDHERRIRDLEKWAEHLKTRYNEISSEITALKLRTNALKP